MIELQDRLLELRTRAGLTRDDAAELAGLSLSLIGLIETGKRRFPRASTLIPLARVLGTSVGYLLDGTGEAPSDRTIRRAVAAARELLAAKSQKATGS